MSNSVDIQIEIEAIEELIALQREKVLLLHRKNSMLQRDGAVMEHDNPMHNDTEAQESSLPRNISMSSVNSKKSAHTEMNNLAPRSVSGNSSVHSSQEIEEMAKQQNAWWFRSKAYTSEPKENENYVDALTRLSRLSTDLANERTLLAWTRTALAAARTTVSFLGLTGLTDFGTVSLRVITIGFSGLALFMMAQAIERYQKIKIVLSQKTPPPGFDRLTTFPTNFILISIFVLVLVVTSSDDWVN